PAPARRRRGSGRDRHSPRRARPGQQSGGPDPSRRRADAPGRAAPLLGASRGFHGAAGGRVPRGDAADDHRQEQQARAERRGRSGSMSATFTFSAAALKIDAAQTADRIESAIRDIVTGQLRRKGAVLGLSGGIDSSVTAALCVRALGRERVIGLFMPEADSSPDSLALGQLMADTLGIRTFLEDITPVLDGAGCYRRRDDAIRAVLPEYGAGYKCKIVLPDLVHSSTYPVFSVVTRSPAGVEKKVRLSADACLGVVAATNFKQRTRKMIEYYYADRFQMAVAGTPNRLEYDQGFFV